MAEGSAAIPVSAAPAGPEDRWALEYRDRALGKLSSHPHWLEHSGALLRRAVIGALILLYVVALYVWLRSHSAGELSGALISWFNGTGGLVCLGILAFALGMLGASSLQNGWAQYRAADVDLDAVADKPATALNLYMLAALTVFGLVVPLVLTFWPGLPVEARMLAPLLALLPVGVLSWVISRGSTTPTKFPWVFTLLAAALWGLTAADAALKWLHSQVFLLVAAWLPVLGAPAGMRRAVIVLATAATAAACFLVARWAMNRKHQAKDQAPPSMAEEQAVQAPVEEAEAAVAKALGVDRANIQTLTPEADETVGWQEASPFEPYFEGKKLTQDQHKVLSDFCSLSVGRFSVPQSSEEPSLGIDMIIEGPSGSGRSSTLDAIALMTVIQQGSRALVFAPDEGRVDIVLRRIRRKLDLLGLNEFVVAGLVSEALAANQAPPEILVTTPLLWEEEVVGRSEAASGEGSQVTDLMCTYSVVLVDDFLDHPLPERLHLPFIVDKHRLLLESRMIPSARVYAFARLSDGGRHLAVNRLIGHSGVRDEARQVSRMRYRRELNARVIDLDSETVGDTVEQVTLAIASMGREAVLLRRGIDAEEANRQTEELRAKAQSQGITVCYCHDQVDWLMGELSAIVMKAAEGPDAVFALRARRPEESLVMVRVKSAKEMQLPVGVTPLIVDRSGRGMAEAHLQSILRFMPDRVPVPLRAWGQLGTPGRIGEPPSDGANICKLILDQPEAVSEVLRRDRPYLRRLGAFMSLSAPFSRYAPVDCRMVPDPGPPWWEEGGGNRYGPEGIRMPTQSAEGSAKQAVVLWKGNDGVELGRSQLQYTSDLLLRRRQTFCPDHFEQDATGGLVVHSMRFRDNGRDGIHPKFELDWVLPAACSGIDQPPGRPVLATGGPSHGFQWVELTLPAGIEVHARLVQRTDDLDRVTPAREFEFCYRASVRPMLLAPSNGLIERFADCQAVLEKLLESGSTWGTSHSDFLPGVTYGLARALADELPSTSFLGRMLAFRLTGEAAQVGGAIVWFVEPLGTGQTLSNAVHELLRGQDYLQQLALRMDQMLAQGWDKSPLVDLARFWLPSRKRSAISNSERALIWSLAGKRKTRDSVQGPTGRFHLQCPHCQERWLEGVSVLTYSRFVMHCDKPIAMLVPTSGGQISTPAQLLSPWWPDELQIPNGSVEARVLAVWDAVATRVTYLLDKHQVEGGEDGWLPPEETWSRRVGDCEDHSLLMASMLRKLGISCWIVWGHANSGGHAWVEVQLGDRVALVEATRKLPLPANLPDAYDAESVREAYGDNYTRGLFEPFDQTPSRTNGTIYDRWADEQWHPIKMADPVPETAPPKP